MLCKPEAQEGGPEDAGPGDDNSHNVDEDEERDPETFDDAELYQQLLKEFLESSAGAGAHTSGVLRVRSAPQIIDSVNSHVDVIQKYLSYMHLVHILCRELYDIALL